MVARFDGADSVPEIRDGLENGCQMALTATS